MRELTPAFKRRLISGDGAEVAPYPLQHLFTLLDASEPGRLDFGKFEEFGGGFGVEGDGVSFLWL